MLVLLPPSEAKSTGGAGPPVDLASLSWSEQLTPLRRTVGDRLVDIAQRDPAAARAMLGLSEALDDDRAADAGIWSSPTMPAGARYAGVLHGALGYPSLSAAARRRADRSVVILSGLWGVTHPCDGLPAYRIGIGTRLSRTTSQPGLPSLPVLWRDALQAALDGEVARRGAIDLRSTGYLQMYRPSARAAARVVSVRVTDQSGRRAAASYVSKLAKGALVRAMLLDGMPDLIRLRAAGASLGLALVPTPGASTVTVAVPDGWTPVTE